MQPEDAFTIINIVETYFEPCKTHRTDAYWLKNRIENNLQGVYTTLPEFMEIMREHGYYTNVKGSLKLKMKKGTRQLFYPCMYPKRKNAVANINL